jgi:hypothetical protein
MEEIGVEHRDKLSSFSLYTPWPRSREERACLASRLRQRVLRVGQCLTSGSKPVSVVNGDGTVPREGT